MIAAMGGLDAVAFTGGIGENDAGIRAGIMEGLDWAGLRFDPEANRRGAAQLQDDASRVAVWLVPADEERHIAAEALDLIGSAPSEGP
jgi:acetate kinase